ncbi:MAG: Crp/Fnr family transcriptional regulator [Phocaeicola sp.]|uniref:Crp/Fnr family transcriptional regulator n=1 Tax=Phocaeicola sp. TaxID=2773926 RepID=UPI0023C4F539|nr:Crp/Fnr family transcriptional regulator [Phocaeicola sp.]MDE5677114.1 Crp/Fnr family transcriptional regulator [Phocaeicola sp.]MDE6181474.1 Crp/Fnr family transcriptional regulator [Phocaeicola sp.]
MEYVIKCMRTLCPLSDETVRELLDCVTLCKFPRKHLLVKADAFCRYAYFIEKGFTRSYWIVDGEEITTSFMGEGGIIFSMDELYYNKKSEEYVETLEEVEAYRIALSDLQRLWRTNHELCYWGLVIHQNEYRRIHQSHKERLSLPAKERYEAFVSQFPNVMQRVNLALVASYLGVTQSTLSRLRGMHE